MSIDQIEQQILCEMEVIKAKNNNNAPSGESSRMCPPFGRLQFFKRRDRHRDQAHESQEAENKVSRATQRRSSIKLNIENKNGICTTESANLDAPAKSFVALTKLYKSFHVSDMDSKTDNHHSMDDEATAEQEMSQSTTSSRRMYASFDGEEPELFQQSYRTLYSYKDSQNISRGDLSICQSISMWSIGGSSMISDWESVNCPLNGKDGGLTGEF